MTIYTGIPAAAQADLLRKRAEECRKAAGFLGILGGLRSAPTLSHVPEKVFLERAGKLPEDLRRRAAHYYAESSRAGAGAAAWKAGDLAKFGRLMNESSESAFDSYEVGGPAIRSLVEIIRCTGGVYGCAYGGGVSLTALVSEDFPEEAGEVILKKFTDMHPELREKAAVYFSGTDDGLRII
jgi:galactokinase